MSSRFTDEELAEIVFDRFNRSADEVEMAYRLLADRGYNSPDEVF